MSLELLSAHKSDRGMAVTFVTEHGIEPMEGSYEEFARLAEVMAQVSVLATVNDHESVWIEEVAVGDALVMLGLSQGRSADPYLAKGADKKRAEQTRRPRSSAGGFLLFEHESVMVEQLSLEADLVGAHAGGERQPEIGARHPAGDKSQLEQALFQAPRPDLRIPTVDRLDVVEASAAARHEAEMRLRASDHLFLAEGQPGAGKLAAEQRDVPLV